VDKNASKAVKNGVVDLSINSAANTSALNDLSPVSGNFSAPKKQANNANDLKKKLAAEEELAQADALIDGLSSQVDVLQEGSLDGMQLSQASTSSPEISSNTTAATGAGASGAAPGAATASGAAAGVGVSGLGLALGGLALAGVAAAAGSGGGGSKGNSAPVAAADVAAGTENLVLTINVLANDRDADVGATLSLVSATTLEDKGAVAIVDAELVFTPGSDFDYLAAGETETVTITYVMKDQQGAQSTSTVTVTITGTNDAAVLSSASVALDETNVALTTSGTLTNSDVDGADTFAAQVNAVGEYGVFNINAAGAWNYVANETFDDLNVGDDPLTDTFTVTAADGTTTTVTVTITGTNDAAVLSVGSEDLTETDAALSTSGILTISDVDSAATFVAQTEVDGDHGVFSIDAAGNWTYDAFDANDDLAEDAVLTDEFTVEAADGTTTTVTIKITGTNDAPVIGGTITGGVTEAGGVENGIAGVPTVSGTLTTVDVDNTEDLFLAVTAGTTSTGGYGTYGMTTAGVWTYTLDNDNANVQARTGNSAPLVDTFTVQSADGTSQVITITITPTNDAAVLSVGSENLTETDVALNTGGQLTHSDVDGADTFVAQADTVGTHGVFNVDTAGLWTYVADSAHDSLNTDNVLTDEFTVIAADGTTTTVTVKITGTNDAAEISGTAAGTVTEAGGADNVTVGTPTATGTLTTTDVDNVSNSFTPESAGVANYGTFVMTDAGTWTYTLDNANATVQALAAAATLNDSFTVYAEDGTPQLITVTITGTNDAPVAVDDAGDAIEAGVADGTDASGNVLTNDTDVDTGDTKTVASVGVNGGILTGEFGTLYLAKDGTYTYELDNTNSTVQALNASSEPLTDSFGYTVRDAAGLTSPANLVITITGSNDAATITASSNEDVIVVETSDLIEGDAAAGGTLTVTDVDAGEVKFAAVDSEDLIGTYGDFTFDSESGVWGYTLDQSKADTLVANEPAIDTLTVYSLDGTANQVITVNITGSNDLATITASDVEDNSVTEAGGTGNVASGNATAGGTLTVADVDAGEAQFAAVNSGDLIGTYGTFTFDSANGVWGYTLDESSANALTANEGATDTLTVSSVDGTDSQTITVNITGSNDDAVITDSGEEDLSLVEAGGLENDVVGDNSAGGTLIATDADDGENQFAEVESPGALAGTYGDFTFDNTTGAWTYTLDQVKAAGLVDGDAFTDTLEVQTLDGTDSRTITVNIAGSDDTAVITASSNEETTVVEAGGTANGTTNDASASGTLTVTDEDAEQGSFAVVDSEALIGTYGTFTFNSESGAWTYALDQAKAESLTDGQEVTDTLQVSSLDNSANQIITVNITGSNDAATITASGVQDTSVTEAGGTGNVASGNATAGGTLTVADVDAGEAQFAAVDSEALTGTYGDFTFNATTGVWGYTLVESRADALTANQAATDTLTVTSTDGTPHTITVNVTGRNDAPVAVADTDEATAAGSGTGANAEGNVLDNDTDADTGDTKTVTSIGTMGTLIGEYGTLTIYPDGSYTYVVDNTDLAVQGLNGEDTLTDTFSYTVRDAAGATSTANLVITVNGANDAAVIDGTIEGDVVEAGGVGNGTEGTLTATGTLSATDLDNDDDSFIAVTTDTLSDAEYGTFQMTAGGVWTYTLDDANEDVQALAEGVTMDDTFTVESADGTDQLITITITGSNDAPTVAEAIADQAATEDVAFSYTVPADAFADIDTGDTLTYSAQLAGGGVLPSWLSFDAETRTFSGTPLNADVDVISVDVTATDGDASVTDTFAITIANVNDAAVISGTKTGIVTEAGGVDNDTGGNPTASGSLGAVDVDNTNDAFIAVDAGTLSTGGYGTYEMSQFGGWTYTLDNTNATVQELTGASDPITDTFTVQSQDGTNQVITITINGANDAPTLGLVTAGTIAEVAGGNLTTDAGLTGKLAGADVDTGATLSYGISGGDPWYDHPGMSIKVGYYGTLTLDNSTGEYTYTKDDAAIEALAAGAEETDEFAFTVSDGPDEYAMQTFTVTVTGANDAPTTTAVTLEAIAEDSGARIITQEQLLANVADVDSSSFWASELTITDGLGTLVDNLDGDNNHLGTWTYTPALNDATSVNFSYTVSDGSLTTEGSATLDTTAVNDAPSGEDRTVTLLEDTTINLMALEFGFSDTADSNAFSGVIISAKPLFGSLLLDGEFIDLNSFVSLAAINSGLLTYTPAADANGAGAASFSFRVVDDGGTDNSGVESDQSANTITFDITPVNDLAAIAQVTEPDSTYTRIITQAELLAHLDPAIGPFEASNLEIASGGGNLVPNSVSGEPDGTWTYTPDYYDQLSVSFTYTITQNELVHSDGNATMDIMPLAPQINDQPDFVLDTDTNGLWHAGTADDETFYVNENQGSVVSAGLGDDSIRLDGYYMTGPEVTTNFAQIDGGAGTDTLVLTSAYSNLNLADFNNGGAQTLTNIEIIDLTAAESQTVTLTAADLFNLSSDTVIAESGENGAAAGSYQTLVINRNGDDDVYLDDSFTQAYGTFDSAGVASQGSYEKYTGSHTDASGNVHLVELLLQTNVG
jgi:VCBS repeat-containing protein